MLVVGHNPTLSYLAFTLSGEPHHPARLDSDGLRTSTLAVHKIHRHLARLRAGTAALAAVHTARAELTG